LRAVLARAVRRAGLRAALRLAPPRRAVDFAAAVLRAPVLRALAVFFAAVLRLVELLRFAAVLRADDLRALLAEAARRLAVLPRLREREPVVRAMFRHSLI
jgi:hypothetical protein